MGYDPVGFTAPAAPNLDGLHNDAVKVTTGILTALDGKQYKNIQTMVTQLIQILKKINKITNEDTAYAGGMGQGGNAGQSYRKFKPKSAGTFKEEQLDEKCWDTHKQVGMKNKGGKQVPNCVPKESAIMKGIKGK
jgi:hypothetical protein